MCSASRCRIWDGKGPSSVRRSAIGLPNTQKEGIIMSNYKHPFSAAYWRTAAREVKDPRKLTFAALMIAMCLVLSAVPSVPLFGGAKVTWGYLPGRPARWSADRCWGWCSALRKICSALSSTGGGGYPFFPGYTLTTMLGVLLYALFFYRARLTVRRIFWAQLFTNVLNVTLGALWMAILSGKACM